MLKRYLMPYIDIRLPPHPVSGIRELTYLLLICSFASCNGQDKSGSHILELKKTIEIPGVTGRIDHMGINVKNNILYLAAVGNNSVEVIDLIDGKIIHSIKGILEPQGIAYIPERNELMVASGGNGNCYFYNAADYTITGTVHLHDDADNVKYNTSNKMIYVGYGEGGIAVINALTHKKIADIKLPAHPEGFQIDEKDNLLFVNVPSANIVSVISLIKMKVTNSWKTNNLHANYPMAIDTANNQIFVGYRRPAVIATYDLTGKELFQTDAVSDIDDLFYYEENKSVFASGGGGEMNLLGRDKNNGFKTVIRVPQRPGTRTSLLISELNTFILAEPASGIKTAAILVYEIKNSRK